MRDPKDMKRGKGSLLSLVPPHVRKGQGREGVSLLSGPQGRQARPVPDRPASGHNSLFNVKPDGGNAIPGAEDPSDLPRKKPLFSGWHAAGQVRDIPDEPASGHDNRPSETRPNDDAWKPLIDPWAIADGIWRSRGIIAATTLCGAALGVAIAVSTPKKYESFAEILIDPRNLQIVDRDLTGSGGLPMEATLAVVENQVRILRSGPVLSKVAQTLNLGADPEFNGTRSSLGLRSLLSSVRSLFSSGDGPTNGERRDALAVENLAKALQVERTGKTFIVMVGAETESAEKSALIANTLIETFVAAAGTFQSDNAGRATDALTSRLEALRKSVEDAERKVEAYKAENDIIDAQGRLISDDEIIKLNEQLGIARAKTIELNAKAASARNLSPEDVLSGNLPEQVASGAMAELRTQYSRLAQDAAKLAARLGPRHPERVDVDAQVADAKAGIAAELKRIVASVQIELKRAVQLEQDLASRLSQLKAYQGNVSDKLVELREMERDAASKRAVYESYLLRARETGEQKDINTGNFTIVSRAVPALEPSGASRALVSMAGMIAGFLAGLGIGALRGAFNSLTSGRRIARPVQIAAAPARFAAKPSKPESRPEPAASIPPEPVKVQEPLPAAAPLPPAPPVLPAPPAPQYWQAPPAMPQMMLPQLPAQQMMMPQMVMPQPVMMQQPAFAPMMAQPYWQQPVMQPWPQMPMAYPAPAAQPAPPPMQAAPQPENYAPAAPIYAREPAPVEHGLHSSQMDDIRGTLREFRDVVRELAEARALRRN